MAFNLTDGVGEARVSSVAPEPSHVPLGTLIFRAGLLNEEQIQDALREGERTGKRLGEILVERGLIGEKEVARLLAKQQGVAFVDLELRPLDRTAVQLLRAETARRYRALPVGFENGTPLVAVTDIADEMTTRAVQEELGREARFVLAAREDLVAALAKAYAQVAAVPEAVPVAVPVASHAASEPAEGAFEAQIPAAGAPFAPPEPEAVDTGPPVEPPPPAAVTPILTPPVEPEPPAPELHVVPAEPTPVPEPSSNGTPPEDAPHWGGSLGELLLESGLLTNEQLEDALREAARRGRRLGEIVLERGWVHERTLAHCLASQKGLPFVSVRDRAADPEAVKLLPRKTAQLYAALPFELDGGAPLVAIADPTNEAAMASVRAAFPSEIRFAVAATSELASALERAYDALEPAPVIEPLQPEPAVEPDAAVSPREDTAPTGAQAFHVAIRLVNSEAVEVGSYASVQEAESEAAAVVKRLASAGPAEWPLFGGRFLRPDAIVSVDIVDET